MAGPDPVDVRLLSALADAGDTTVPELAGHLGMDVRDVAARLAALSTTGLPLTVQVDCDQRGLRNAVAQAQAFTAAPPGPGMPPNAPQPPAAPPGSASGGYPAPPPGALPPQHPSGGYPVPPAPPSPSGPHSSPHPSGPQPSRPQPSGPQQTGGAPPDPMHTWGPPAGSAAWARGDHSPSGPRGGGNTVDPLAAERTRPAMNPQRGKIGSTLEVAGPGGELAIQLVEVVDPADYFFSAAGHELGEGERAVVVHTELTNRSPVTYQQVPDEHLVLVAEDGTTLGKSGTTLTSRPPHSAPVQPGATAGGHTVYVVPEPTRLVAVRWSPTAEETWWSLTWDVTDL
ncbi:hypothetical protein GCM10027174_36190 [Salinifilum aidingensis]